jgi:DNA-binding ferritin-like protein (Dps family)
MLNNKIYSNNNNILLEVTSKLNGLISDLTDNKAYKIIIARIKDIINLVNNVIIENKKNTDLIRKDIQTLNDNIISLS